MQLSYVYISPPGPGGDIAVLCVNIICVRRARGDTCARGKHVLISCYQRGLTATDECGTTRSRDSPPSFRSSRHPGTRTFPKIDLCLRFEGLRGCTGETNPRLSIMSDGKYNVRFSTGFGVPTYRRRRGFCAAVGPVK